MLFTCLLCLDSVTLCLLIAKGVGPFDVGRDTAGDEFAFVASDPISL